MKKGLLVIILLSAILFSSCSEKVDTGITLKNIAASSIVFNFRAEVITVPSGQTIELKAVPKGIYEYSTTYSVPANATNSTATGPLSGEVEIKAGTKILLLYSSTFSNGQYNLYVTMTSNNDQTSTDTGTTNP